MDNAGKTGQCTDIAIYEKLCAADIDANATRAFERSANGKNGASKHGFVKNEQSQKHNDDKRCKRPGDRVETAGLGGAAGNHHP